MTKKETNKLDKLWAEAVKLRADNKCEWCGKMSGLNSHHIFSRSNRTVRHDPDNGVCLCVSHHVFGNQSAHKSPVEFIEWLRNRRGEAWYEVLRGRANIISKNIDYEAVREELISEIKELK